MKKKIELTTNELELIYDMLGEKFQESWENWKTSTNLSKQHSPDMDKAWRDSLKYQALRDIIKYYLGRSENIDSFDLELLHLVNESSKID